MTRRAKPAARSHRKWWIMNTAAGARFLERAVADLREDRMGKARARRERVRRRQTSLAGEMLLFRPASGDIAL